MARELRIALLSMLVVLAAASVQAAQLFPMKTGIVLEYNSSDNDGHAWHMKMQVMEQVTLAGKQYYHLRQTDYDPYQGNLISDFYLRSTDTEIYSFTGAEEVVVFRAADKGTTWNYPYNYGTVYSEIFDIADVTVPYGGPYTAYIHRSYFKRPDNSTSPYWFDYIVPGLTNVKGVDNWLDDPARVPLQYVLASLKQGGGNPGLMLLLD
jgi:hypothetical protein